jgi:hypothetical protein
MDAALIRLVWLRAGNCCEYCRLCQEFDETPFEIDHIISKKHKGRTIAGNLALSCSRCNSYKGTDISGRDVITRQLTPLFNPRRHKWARHFRWHGAHLIGRTPIGRVTVELLNMNASFRVALRDELIEQGVFPPE